MPGAGEAAGGDAAGDSHLLRAGLSPRRPLAAAAAAAAAASASVAAAAAAVAVAFPAAVAAAATSEIATASKSDAIQAALKKYPNIS